MNQNRLQNHHRKLLEEHRAISKTLAEFENRLMDKFQITSSEISNPETYWKISLENEAKLKDLQQKTFLEKNQQKFQTKSFNDEKTEEAEEHQNCTSYKMLSNCLDHKNVRETKKSIEKEIPENQETIEDKPELILIKSKNILIGLIDKEIDRCSNKNHLKKIQSIDGAGDSNNKSEEKEKRLKIITKIKSELEILENLELSV